MYSITELLIDSAKRYPTKTAIQTPELILTYCMLLHKAQAAGTYISELGVINRPVIILCDRDPESIIAFLGTLFSGNFYVPIDNAQPLERVKKMISQIGPAAIIGREKMCTIIVDDIDVPCMTFENLMHANIDYVKLEGIRNRIKSDDPACCIFTSGSSGEPKGVLKSHRSILKMTEIFTEKFGFSADDVFGSQTSLEFDVSNKTIYVALANGSSINIIPAKMLMFPGNISEYLEKEKISVAFWTVSLLSLIAEIDGLKKKKPSGLKKVLFSGEAITVKVMSYWTAHLPETLFVNLYGPTEMTGNATFFQIDNNKVYDKIPIGKAFPDTEIFLFDSNDKIITDENSKGEICIGGDCLALGYYNLPGLTAKSFVREKDKSGREILIYRTGDIGYRNADGDLIFCGRYDFQIKRMGYRIELEEIENAAMSIGNVSASCCIYNNADSEIIMFYEGKENINSDLIRALRNMLPRYMNPNRIIYLEKMPRNAHDKPNRELLKKYIWNEDLKRQQL